MSPRSHRWLRILSCIALVLSLSAACAYRPAAAAASDEPAIRTVILVRHGEYDHDDKRDEVSGKGLVELGREQAKLLGKRLVAEGWRFDSLHVSTLRRARETADILGASLRMTPHPSPDLAECTPSTHRKDIMDNLGPGEADSCEAQLERALSRYLRPAHGSDARDMVVCHGNVIRYTVCRVLGVDPKAWLNMRITNCGITEIEVKENGELRLITFNDVGHLPLAKRTSTRTARTAPR